MSALKWADLAAGYVLETLDPAEHEAFEERLAEDVELRAEVDSYRSTIAVMSGLPPRVEPPELLKTRVLAAATEGRTRSPVPSSEDRTWDGVPPSRMRRRATFLPWVAAAAGVLVALGFGVVAQRAERARSALEGRLEIAETSLDATVARLAERDSLLATFLGPDVRTAVLSSTGQPPSARLFWNTTTSTLLVTAFGLPPAPEGRVYQLWGIPSGQSPVSLGTFQTEADGSAVVRRAAPSDVTFELGAVTEEPAGGSAQPTSAPFLVGTWAGG